MQHPSRPRDRRAPRSGFTLIELLVVILILGILIALLVPAIAGAVRSANNARIAGEFNALATALADFKNQYGEYPPSRIMLVENGFYNTATNVAVSQPNNAGDITLGALAARSHRYLSKFFPRSQSFSTSGFVPSAYQVDYNRDGSINQWVILQGHECLVFFLGGMPTYDSTTQTYSLTGFSKDPSKPLDYAGATRTRPLYEFTSSRLLDIYSTPQVSGGADSNFFPSYMDPLGSNLTDHRPYAYFSSYGNNGYDPNDDNYMGIGNYVGGQPDATSREYDDTGTVLVSRIFRTTFPPGQENSFAPNPYTSGDPTASPTNYINPQSFQLICAGRDRQFGPGGAFVANSTTEKLPVGANEAALQGLRIRERDNVTNFTTGAID